MFRLSVQVAQVFDQWMKGCPARVKCIYWIVWSLQHVNKVLVTSIDFSMAFPPKPVHSYPFGCSGLPSFYGVRVLQNEGDTVRDLLVEESWRFSFYNMQSMSITAIDKYATAATHLVVLRWSLNETFSNHSIENSMPSSNASHCRRRILWIASLPFCPNCKFGAPSPW